MDYWLIVEDLPFAAQRRRSLALLRDASHEVLIRGPEGEQVRFDEKGRRERGSKARTEYIGFEKYRRKLEAEAGLTDPDEDFLVEQLRKADAFWGEDGGQLDLDE